MRQVNENLRALNSQRGTTLVEAVIALGILLAVLVWYGEAVRNQNALRQELKYRLAVNSIRSTLLDSVDCYQTLKDYLSNGVVNCPSGPIVLKPATNDKDLLANLGDGWQGEAYCQLRSLRVMLRKVDPSTGNAVESLNKTKLDYSNAEINPAIGDWSVPGGTGMLSSPYRLCSQYLSVGVRVGQVTPAFSVLPGISACADIFPEASKMAAADTACSNYCAALGRAYVGGFVVGCNPVQGHVECTCVR